MVIQDFKMSDKPPPYNPDLYQTQSSYPPPPPPYQTQPPTASTTIYTGVSQAGRSTTIITGPSYGTVDGNGTPVVVQSVPVASVIMVGGCPACRVGVLNEEFTLGGLCCAFWFFPIGLLCCLAMRERRCTNCGATFAV